MLLIFGFVSSLFEISIDFVFMCSNARLIFEKARAKQQSQSIVCVTGSAAAPPRISGSPGWIIRTDST